MVQTQVASQIKVRDLSAAKVTLAPAEYASWSDARTELMTEAKTALKARLEAELAAAGSDSELTALKTKFAQEERDLEHNIDNTVHTFSACIDMEYNFLSGGK